MNEPPEPGPDKGEDPIKWWMYPWHWLQLAAWHVWPSNDCIYCFFYRGVILGLIAGSITTWLIMR